MVIEPTSPWEGIDRRAAAAAPVCETCGCPLYVPTPKQYLDLLNVVSHSAQGMAGDAVRGDLLLRPYDQILQLGETAHRAVCRRRSPSSTNGRLPQVVSQTEPADAGAVSLTVREEQVLGLLLTGASTTDIADRLYISSHTVIFHVKRLMKKFGVRSKVALVAKVASATQQSS